MKHNNNFDALRLIAAFMVLVSHQFALSGRDEPLVLSTFTYGQIGVAAFFSISGLLIAASWEREPRLRPFALKRFLRIAPAFACCLAICALAVMAITPAHWREAVNFAVRNLFLGRYDADFFPGQPMTQLNGSIWTIRVEVSCYAVLAALAMVVRRQAVWVMAVALALYMVQVLVYVDSGLQPVTYTLLYVAAFFMGALLHAVPWLRARAGWLIAGAIGVAASGRVTLGLLLFMPAFIASVGSRSWPVLRRFGRFGDVSYGLYLWAWPVQQCVTLLLGKDTPVAVLIAVSALVTLGLALASWHLLEKRALRWKPGALRTGAAPKKKGPANSPSL